MGSGRVKARFMAPCGVASIRWILMQGHAHMRRRIAAGALGLGLFWVFVAAASGGRRSRADFAFGNGGEVTTLDPARVTGIPEGRVMRALYEGLTVKDPETLAPLPGVAESWEIGRASCRERVYPWV